MVKGEFYDISNNSSSESYNRYKDCKVLKDIDTQEVLLSTREDKYISTSSTYTVSSLSREYATTSDYHRVLINETTRLDIIAGDYYKNPLLWWVIAQANDIYDPFIEIPVGTLLKIPTLVDLYGNNGILL